MTNEQKELWKEIEEKHEALVKALKEGIEIEKKIKKMEAKLDKDAKEIIKVKKVTGKETRRFPIGENEF